jgi:hypothetical protein
MGSLLDEKPIRKRSVLTEETLDDTGARHWTTLVLDLERHQKILLND